MWLRVMDEDTGVISWVRTNFKDAMAVSKANEMYNDSVIHGPRHRPSQCSTSGHSSGDIFGGGSSYGSGFGHSVLQGVERDNYRSASRDSFDPTLTSKSPGFSSYLNSDGDLQWMKVRHRYYVNIVLFFFILCFRFHRLKVAELIIKPIRQP
jgi:hypothetical protein